MSLGESYSLGAPQTRLGRGSGDTGTVFNVLLADAILALK
jgi:hypothetical protein